MDRSAALASSIVASTPDRGPLQQLLFGQHAEHPLEHPLVRFYIQQSSGPRDGGVVRHVLIQPDPRERANRQAVAGAPGDPTLRVDPFEVTHQQQPKIDPWRQSRPTHFASVESLTQSFDTFIESTLIQNLSKPMVKRM